MSFNNYNNMSNSNKFRIYNGTLDPLLWDKAGNLKPEISNVLLKIAMDFYESIEIKPPLHDVLLLGSAASYNYNDSSDIDVHLCIDLKDFNMPEEDEAQKFVDALKTNWNDKHNIKIRGKKVEVYIQDVKHQTRANGIYSLMKSHWLKMPKKEDTSSLDRTKIKQIYNEYVQKIEQVLYAPNIESIKKVLKDIYDMREAGLSSTGELSNENIAFKAIRNKGWLTKIKSLKDTMYDKKMSVTESVSEIPDWQKQMLKYLGNFKAHVDRISRETGKPSNTNWGKIEQLVLSSSDVSEMREKLSKEGFNFINQNLSANRTSKIKEFIKESRRLPTEEAIYRGKKVKLNKLLLGSRKKYKMYIKHPRTGKIREIHFGYKKIDKKIK